MQKIRRVEVFADLTLAMIPESLSFAILAGLSPLTGLYAAFLMGLTTGFWEVDLVLSPEVPGLR
ncbi:SulP family inorganic anion transporter [Leadbetterella byssophila]|uniref:SulP family inorganic anion transporter n=1 Tax=Leadbetterella byssophila TaxID=316068 RepID=UPI0039A2DD10